jgi:hypothetical protein
MKIYKYEISPPNPNGDSFASIPEGGEILSAGVQGDNIFLWAAVDPSAPMSRRNIRVYGTGWEVDGAPGTFINTVFMHGGTLVFHVFEDVK